MKESEFYEQLLETANEFLELKQLFCGVDVKQFIERIKKLKKMQKMRKIAIFPKRKV